MSKIKDQLVTASHGSSHKDQWQWSRALSESDHYLTVTVSSLKIGFQASFDSACSHFTPSQGSGISSPVIVIIRICVSSFDRFSVRSAQFQIEGNGTVPVSAPEK